MHHPEMAPRAAGGSRFGRGGWRERETKRERERESVVACEREQQQKSEISAKVSLCNRRVCLALQFL
jgi:hypothetical protein